MRKPNLSVTHIAAEHADLIHSGGLGEVIRGLSKAQARAGSHVEVILPGYPAAMERLAGEEMGEVDVDLPWGRHRFHVIGARHDNVDLRLLKEPALFGRPGIYGDEVVHYADNPVRFAAFSQAAAKLAAGADVVHLHDWHVGLAAPHLASWQGPGPRPMVVMTVHSLASQGAFPRTAAGIVGLSPDFFDADGVLHQGRINPLKAGLHYADKLTTVSPTYARELQTEALGWDLAGLFRRRTGDLMGIVNGLTSPAPMPPEPRQVRRAALCTEVGIDEPSGPVFAVVSRLAMHKGIDLLLDAWPTLPGDVALVVLGKGDPALAGRLRAMADASPERLAFVDDADPVLADQILFGADVVCVPSRFEPCGSVQLRGMHSGALALVRRTGGLADTVVDLAEGGWGFVFDEASAEALSAAMMRAIELFGDTTRWAEAVALAAAQSVGWDAPAARYEQVYHDALLHNVADVGAS